MKSPSALDVVTVLVTILLSIFLCVLGGSVFSYRELEFNRMWRTRLFLVSLVLFFTLTLSLSSLHWFPDRFVTVGGRSIACGMVTWACHCVFLPLFLAIVIGLIHLLADSSALLSTHPNRRVLRRAFRYCLPVLFLGLVNVVLALAGVDVGLFATYDRNDGYCEESSYLSILLTLFLIIIFIRVVAVTGHCSRGDNATRPRLNILHMQRIRRLSLNVIPFIIFEGVSVISRPIPIVLRGIVFVGFIACLFVYLYYFIIAPLREASVAGLPRGNLLTRREKFLRGVTHRETASDADRLIRETEPF
jgi:hypothetical protein